MSDDMIGYISRYGGRCRDCADNNGICPYDSLPCEPAQREEAIKHVLSARAYGLKHRYITESEAT